MQLLLKQISQQAGALPAPPTLGLDKTTSSLVPKSKTSKGGQQPPKQTQIVSRRQAASVRGSMRDNSAYPDLPGMASVARSSYALTKAGQYMSYAQAASSSRGLQSSYIRMLLNPTERQFATRYPDETIVPTGLVHFSSALQLYSPNSGNTNRPYVAMRWKCLTSAGVGNEPIRSFQDFTTGSSSIVYQDYGAPQTAWSQLTSVDRTLAFGMRVSLVALPPNSFMPPGRLYLLQIQDAEYNALQVPLQQESTAIELVMAGKGFSITTAELARSASGIVAPYLPQGPMSYLFSDVNSTGAAGDGGATTSGVVAPNAWVVMIGYGFTQGTTLEVRPAHHIEYIPTAAAAGLIATIVQPPSSTSREGIASTLGRIQNAMAGSFSGDAIQKALSGIGGLASLAGPLMGGAGPALGFAAGAINSLRGSSGGSQLLLTN